MSGLVADGQTLVTDLLTLVPDLVDQITSGETLQFQASTPSTAIFALPTVAGLRIKSAFIRCPNQSPNTKRLTVSFDGGTNFLSLAPGEFVSHDFEGAPNTQVHLQSNVSSVNYEVILNRVV
jgi:hypothetical protein